MIFVDIFRFPICSGKHLDKMFGAEGENSMTRNLRPGRKMLVGSWFSHRNEREFEGWKEKTGKERVDGLLRWVGRSTHSIREI